MKKKSAILPASIGLATWGASRVQDRIPELVGWVALWVGLAGAITLWAWPFIKKEPRRPLSVVAALFVVCGVGQAAVSIGMVPALIHSRVAVPSSLWFFGAVCCLGVVVWLDRRPVSVTHEEPPKPEPQKPRDVGHVAKVVRTWWHGQGGKQMSQRAYHMIAHLTGSIEPKEMREAVSLTMNLCRRLLKEAEESMDSISEALRDPTAKQVLVTWSEWYGVTVIHAAAIARLHQDAERVAQYLEPWEAVRGDASRKFTEMTSLALFERERGQLNKRIAPGIPLKFRP